MKPPLKYRAIDGQTLRQLWFDLVPTSEIALHFGVSTNTIRSAVSRHGLPARDARVVRVTQQERAEDEASASTLAIAPGLRERAEMVKRRHYDAMRLKT